MSHHWMHRVLFQSRLKLKRQRRPEMLTRKTRTRKTRTRRRIWILPEMGPYQQKHTNPTPTSRRCAAEPTTRRLLAKSLASVLASQTNNRAQSNCQLKVTLLCFQQTWGALAWPGIKTPTPTVLQMIQTLCQTGAKNHGATLT